MRFPCDTHTHTARCGHAGGSDEAFVEAAIAASCDAIAVTDHVPFYWLPAERFDPTLAMPEEELPRYVDAVLALKERYAGRIEVLLGLEADWVDGAGDVLARILERYPWDVVLGSVHWLDGWWVDAPSALPRYRAGQQEVDRIWRRYAEEVQKAARSGLFDVLAHLDLPKKFGFRASEGFGGLEAEVIDAVVDSRCAVELSSGGLRKPVGEVYPSAHLAAALADRAVPFVLSSDSHAPDEIGHRFADLVDFAGAADITEVAVCRQRHAELVPLPRRDRVSAD